METKYLVQKTEYPLLAYRYTDPYRVEGRFKPSEVRLAYSKGTIDIAEDGLEFLREPVVGDWVVERIKGIPFFASTTFVDRYFYFVKFDGKPTYKSLNLPEVPEHVTEEHKSLYLLKMLLEEEIFKLHKLISGGYHGVNEERKSFIDKHFEDLGKLHGAVINRLIFER